MLLSWHNQVYLPVINIIKKQKMMKKFKGRTPSDMYVWIIKYWDDLKTKFGNDYSLDTAASDFSNEFGSNKIKKLLNKIKIILKLDG